MFERFTERARQVVVLAQEEARALRHNYIGTEHLLLGLVREEEGLAAHVLESLGITLEGVRGEVTRIVGSGEETSTGQIPFTPRAKKVMELALREAQSLNHDHIATEHLLLGLARENEGVAARILLDLGADAEKIHRAVLRMLSGPSGRRASRPSPPAATAHHAVSRAPLDWQLARMLWRPEGLELRVPLHLGEGAIATFAADEAWGRPPLAGLRREIWNGWVALASPTLLEDCDPQELRRALDAAAVRAGDVRGREQGRVEDFLRGLRAPPAAAEDE